MSASLHPPHAPETGCNRRRGQAGGKLPHWGGKVHRDRLVPRGESRAGELPQRPIPFSISHGERAPRGGLRAPSPAPHHHPGAPPAHVTVLLGSGGEQQDKEPEQRQPPRGTPAGEAETQGLPTAPPRDPPPAPPSRPRSSPWAHGARCPPPVRGSARLRSARLGPGAERGGAGAAEGSARPQPPVPGPGGRWWVVGGTAMEHPPWGAARRAGSPQRDPAHPAPSWRPPALPQRLPGCIGEWGARGSPPASPGALPSPGCGEQQPPAGHPAAQRLASPRRVAAASRFASCPRPSFLLPAAPAWRRAG